MKSLGFSTSPTISMILTEHADGARGDADAVTFLFSFRCPLGTAPEKGPAV